MENDNNDSNENTIEWVDDQIKEAMTRMLPSASREQYVQTYKKYQEWREEKHLKGKTNEKELFAYLHHMLLINKWVSPGTLWSRFSMLRSMILAKEGLDIKTTNVNATIQTWLKRVGASHKTKQANMFTKEQARKFIKEAPEAFIVQKLILLVGVYTGLRCDTMTRLEWRHVQMKQEQVSIFIDYESKTDQGAAGMWFALAGAAEDPSYNAYVLFSKYKQILEDKNKKLTDGRLWVRIDDNKDGTYKVCQQIRGIEWISSVPAKVATWLCLPEAEKYTGHSLRRTCAQWAADQGMSETQMQHHFGWKSAAMVVRYSRSSSVLKQTMAKCLNIEADESKEKEEKKQNRSMTFTTRGEKRRVRNDQAESSNSGSQTESESSGPDGLQNEKKAKNMKTKKPAYLTMTDPAHSKGASSKQPSEPVDNDVISGPPLPIDINKTIGSMFSGCTFGSANFSVTIQGAAPPIAPSIVVYTDVQPHPPGIRDLSLPIDPRPKLKLLFKDTQKE
jgi:integrase